MKKRIVGILIFATAAGAGIFALAQATFAPTKSPPVIENGPSPTVAAPSGLCAYAWACESLPEITTEFQAAVQAVLPEAEAHATAFGENCGYEDGSVTFGAMETDFYLRVPVSDLFDDEALGSFIEKVLSITDGFASPRVPGLQEGFVEFTFLNGTEQRIVRVPIPLGKRIRGQSLHSAELLKALENP